MTARAALTTTLLLVLCAGTLFFRLDAPNFYHLRNESRRAQIAREMLQTGNWLIPQIEEETILTKPPVFYWAVALCSRSSGVTERTARLPSAVAGVGIMLATLLLGRMLFGQSPAWLSASVLLSTNFFIHQARYAELEALLALFTTATVYCFWRGYRAPSRAWPWYALFFVMLGCGMMTKGPFALTFPLIPIVSYLVVYGEAKRLVQRQFLAPSLFFLLVVLPWPLAVMRQYPDFYKLVLWETVIRAATGHAHREPFYYYIAQLPRAFFPWIFFLPFAAAAVFMRRTAPARRQLVFVLVWFFGNLLFLSLLKSKRDYYLFPLTPAAALLVGATWQPCWQRLCEALRSRKALYGKVLCGAGLVCAAAAAVADNPCAVNFPALHFPEVSPFLFCAAVLILVPWCCRKLLPDAALRYLVVGTAVVYMLAAQYVYVTLTVPIMNAEDSGKNFYRTVSMLVPPETPLGFVKSYENYTFTFYARRPLTTLKDEEDVGSFMASEEKRFLVLTANAYNRMQPMPWRTVFRSPYAEHESWRGYVLLCNR